MNVWCYKCKKPVSTEHRFRLIIGGDGSSAKEHVEHFNCDTPELPVVKGKEITWSASRH